MKEVKVSPIRNGTVIDHIEAGQALNVLSILGVTGGEGSVVAALMNVKSPVHKSKDVVKLEGMELKARDVDKISLIAPNATISIIRDYEIFKKHHVKLPKVITGIVKCDSPNCITNGREPVESEFLILSKKPMLLRCKYCEREMDDVSQHIV